MSGTTRPMVLVWPERKPAGQDIGLVAQLLHRAQDTLPELVADIAGFVDDMRDGGDRDARGDSNISYGSRHAGIAMMFRGHIGILKREGTSENVCAKVYIIVTY